MAVDKFYFRKPRSVSSVCISLKPGSGLMEFSSDAEYVNCIYKVVGYDNTKGENVSGESAAKASNPITNAIGAPGEWYLSDPACESKAQADNRAKGMARLAVQRAQKAVLKCIGLPEIIPGRFVKVERVDATVNKKYYVKQVVHHFEPDEGFTTEIITEGWE